MHFSKDFNYSYWEISQYFRTSDLVVIGSGIVGLSAAISFKTKHPKAKVLILERGLLPDGASTKNAGFACFGSAGELLDDLKHMPESTVWDTVAMRWEGLQLLRKRLKDKNLDYKGHGGFELFDTPGELHNCLEELDVLNKNMQQVIGLKNCYSQAPLKTRLFRQVSGVIKNAYEGQIDTGLMMTNLLQLAQTQGIRILNTVSVSSLSDSRSGVSINSSAGTFRANKVLVATNGFAAELLKIKDLKPARAQVLITKPIPGLKVKGTFHFQQGYYYFRNIHNRLLFGGGRNLDFKTETTTRRELNPKIHTQLDKLLGEVILPGTAYEVEHRWSGIMGVGREKKPIIKQVSSNIVAAVRMGGMGIAIGSLVGELAAKEVA